MLKWFCFIALLAKCMTKDLAIEDEILTFTLNGGEHSESRKIEDNIVTFTDVMDGFLATLDYERDILMIKNLTSQTCYFSRLESMPIQRNDETALFVREVTTEANLETWDQNVDEVVFSPTGKIPSDYVLLTNDVIVAGECVSQPSYWLEMKAASRQRRDCDAVCGAGIVLTTVVVLSFLG